MSGIDDPRYEDVGGQGDGQERGEVVPAGVTWPAAADPAACAASMIEEQTLSILRAVEVTTSDIRARAAHEAEEIVRQLDQAISPARARLDEMSRALEAMSLTFDRGAGEPAEGRSHVE
jgi:hypothetical protein